MQKLWHFLGHIRKKVFFYTIFNWKFFKAMAWWKKTLSLLTLFFILIIFTIFAIEVNFLWLFGKMPDISKTENKLSASSEIFTSDGVSLGKYYIENRSPVEFKDLSKTTVNALLATEDIRFYQHYGIDFSALGSAFLSTLTGDKRGASTITQQLAKNLFKTRATSDGLLAYIPIIKVLNSKLKEWITAVKLEFKYEKNEILTMYLNTVDFGNSAYGIRTASKTYFNKKPSELNTEQSAMLIGVLKATTSYNPILHPDKCLERRNIVLKQLKRYNFINEKEYNIAFKKSLSLNVQIEKSTTKIAPYFKTSAMKFLNKWCDENGYDLYTDGLKIYTTLDSRIQKHAEEAVQLKLKSLQDRFYAHWGSFGTAPWQLPNESNKNADDYPTEILKKMEPFASLFKSKKDSLAKIKMKEKRKMKVFTWEGGKDSTISALDSVKHTLQIMQTGLLSLDPKTGYIKAWVGGVNHEYFSFDHVYQAKRQPGSTFKPFVYTEAFERGLAPCDKLLDAPVTVFYKENGEDKSWTPNNSDYEYAYGEITLRKGMATSKNTITARLTEKYSWDSVYTRAKKMGIKSSLKSVPSIGLGSGEVSLFEMVGAYSSFMNEGVWTEPQFIAKIEDKSGKVIYEAKPNKRRVMSEETAFLMTDMFKATMQEQKGTSQALWEFNLLFDKGNEIGGKTGTSSNYADGWYIGLTEKLVTGVWVGGDDHRIRFRSSDFEASQTALPVFGIFMQSLYADTKLGFKAEKYPEPKIKINKQYGCLSPFVYQPKKEENEGKEENSNKEK